MNKKKIYAVIAVALLIILVGGATYAYFMQGTTGSKTINVQIATDTEDAGMYEKGEDISILASYGNFSENNGSLTGSTYAKAIYKKGTMEGSTGIGHYSVYFDISRNEFIYTQNEVCSDPTYDNESDCTSNEGTWSKPAELILEVTTPANSPITLKDMYGRTITFPEVTNKTIRVEDSENPGQYINETVSGYDITGYTGTIILADNKEITNDDPSNPTEETWNIKMVMVNLDGDQTGNYGAKFNGQIHIQSNKVNPPIGGYVAYTLYTSDGENGLYYHDGIGSYTNYTEEAGDLSYRYSGSNPANYVCFGYDVDSDDDTKNANICSSDSFATSDYIYRIIGAFKNEDTNEYEVKLIKYNILTTTYIGTGQNNGVDTWYWQGSSSSSLNNNWHQSTLNSDALNTRYANKIDVAMQEGSNTTWKDIITDHVWVIGGAISDNVKASTVKTAYYYEILHPADSGTNMPANDKKYSDPTKIGLMYVTDYAYATTPDNWTTKLSSLNTAANRDNNWLFKSKDEYTITRSTSSANYAYAAYDSGYVYDPNVNNAIYVKPSFYLSSNVRKIDGSGTINNPYILGI